AKRTKAFQSEQQLTPRVGEVLLVERLAVEKKRQKCVATLREPLRRRPKVCCSVASAFRRPPHVRCSVARALETGAECVMQRCKSARDGRPMGVAALQAPLWRPPNECCSVASVFGRPSNVCCNVATPIRKTIPALFHVLEAYPPWRNVPLPSR